MTIMHGAPPWPCITSSWTMEGAGVWCTVETMWSTIVTVWCKFDKYILLYGRARQWISEYEMNFIIYQHRYFTYRFRNTSPELWQCFVVHDESIKTESLRNRRLKEGNVTGKMSTKLKLPVCYFPKEIWTFAMKYFFFKHIYLGICCLIYHI